MCWARAWSSAKIRPTLSPTACLASVVSDVMEYAIENGYTVEEVDRLTGDLIGRPKSWHLPPGRRGRHRCDGVGQRKSLPADPHDEDREVLHAATTPPCFKTLLDNKLLGSKSGQGFYKTVVGEKAKRASGPWMCKPPPKRAKLTMWNRRSRVGKAWARSATATARSSARTRQCRRPGGRFDLAHAVAHNGLCLKARA